MFARPTAIGQLFGQDHILPLLTSWESDPTKIPHALLLSGPYGVGKTTIARILSQKLITTQADYEEINIGSNRGIDEVRSLIESLRFSPFGSSKVYVLDEFQGMTPQGQSAFLKVLEEPPPNTYFFLCTTEPSKLVPMIFSRCIQVELRLLSQDATEDLVLFLSKGKLSKEQVEQICMKAQGHARDAVNATSLLLQSGSILSSQANHEMFGQPGQVRTIIQKAVSDQVLTTSEIQLVYNYPDETYMACSIDQAVDDWIKSGHWLPYDKLLNIRSKRKLYLVSAKEQFLHLITVPRV